MNNLKTLFTSYFETSGKRAQGIIFKKIEKACSDLGLDHNEELEKALLERLENNIKCDCGNGPDQLIVNGKCMHCRRFE